MPSSLYTTMATRKSKNLAKKAEESLAPHQKRYFAVWRYQNKYKCSLLAAYMHVYKVPEATASASLKRFETHPDWLDVCAKMEEAASVDPDALKVDLTALLLQLVRDDDVAPNDRIKAAHELAAMYGITEQKITISADPATLYAQQVMEQASAQPLIPPPVIDAEVVSD